MSEGRPYVLCSPWVSPDGVNCWVLTLKDETGRGVRSTTARSRLAAQGRARKMLRRYVRQKGRTSFVVEL